MDKERSDWWEWVRMRRSVKWTDGGKIKEYGAVWKRGARRNQSPDSRALLGPSAWFLLDGPRRIQF